MSRQPGELLPRRILVAVDASAASLAALEAAVDLAARTQAELLGLFVEDINLVRLGRLPFAPHVSLTSGAGEPLDAPALEAQLRALAAQARAALEAAAGRTRVSVSFRVVRGSVEHEVLAAAGDADLLILGGAGRSLSRGGRLGRTARAAAERAAGPVLLLPRGARLAGPVLVVYDGGPGSVEALAGGARLAGALGREVVVLAAAPSLGEARELGGRARAWLEARGLTADARPCVNGEGSSLRSAIRAAGPGILVVNPESPAVRGGRLLDEIGGPVLVTR